MAKKYLSPLNLLNLTSDPGTAAEGDFYWNSSTNRLRIYFDGAWADVSSNTAFTNAANTFTTAQTITPATSLTGLTINAAASSIGLILKANATTPADIQQWQNSAGSVLSFINSNGAFSTQGLAIPTATGEFSLGGTAGGTQYTNSIIFNSGNSTNPIHRIRWTGGGSGNPNWEIGTNTTLQTNKNWLVRYIEITPNVRDYIPLRIQGTDGTTILSAFSGQTANLQEWNNSAGTTLSRVDNNGRLGLRTSVISSASLSVSTDSTTVVPVIIRGIASQTADLIQAQNSAGSVVFKVSPTGVINAGTSTTIGNILNFSDPGVGVETRFNFLRASDSAWLAVNEMTSDSTYYEFGMADNPSGGDYFQWRFDNYEAPSHGWMPLQMSGFTTRFTAASNTMYGNFALPFNTPYAMINNAAFNSASLNVNRYTPTQSTSQALFKDAGTGTGTVTLNSQSYSGSSRAGYWIEIEAGATTFKWGTGYVLNTPTATAVAIT
jgi:hypothetical protein